MQFLIPAAGSGKRMGGDRNKLLLPLLGEPILSWTLKAALAADSLDWIGIICQPIDLPHFCVLVETLNPAKPVVFLPGGATRQASVYNGLSGLPAGSDRVLVHDGARCLATPELFDRCAAALATCDGLIAAVPVKDTIKIADRVDPHHRCVASTPERDRLWAAQTPQGFAVKLLRDCHRRGRGEAWEVTDDAALFERCGLPVAIIPGEETNLKVTTRQDLAIAEFILRSRLSGGRPPEQA